jgi:hypothetical protein
MVILGNPSTNKRRAFRFDHAFSPSATQADIYETIASPIVSDVLKGVNGTIFAYGQTGTGKTYTMGILDKIQSAHGSSDETMGVVPRALRHVFTEIGAGSVTVSFIQIYCETIQDLLAPGTVNLNIRESPSTGFYVQNLTEYAIESYAEAEALINLGLENRAMAPTLMNSTSSRSHTVLTVKVTKQADAATAGTSTVTTTGKLLLVDLAGSERIRRTTSSGVRLSEARSINASLSALGNVITALALSARHVPFRDSKLTKLLQDAIGGNSSTALIATVGPAPVNEAESLSTMMFGERCMQVKSSPYTNTFNSGGGNWEDECAKLAIKLAASEEEFVKKMTGEAEKYEGIIRRLAGELRSLRSNSVTSNASIGGVSESDDVASNKALSVSSGRGRRSSYDISAAFATNDVVKALATTDGFGEGASESVLAGFNLVYKMLCQCADESSTAVYKYNIWSEMQTDKIEQQIKEEEEADAQRASDTASMASHDTLDAASKASLGPHLKSLTKKDARERVTARFATGEDGNIDMTPVFANGKEQVTPHPELTDFASTAAVMEYCDELLMTIRKNGEKLEMGLWEKAEQFFEAKQELAEDMYEKRQREEEVVNWSFVLKYLLSTNSKLRKQLSGRDALRGILVDDSSTVNTSMTSASMGNGNSSMHGGRGGAVGGGSAANDVTPARNNRMMPQEMPHAQQNSATQDSAHRILQRRRQDDDASNISALESPSVGGSMAGTPSTMGGTPSIVGGGKDDINESPRSNVSMTSSHMSPDRVKKLLPNNTVANALIDRVRQMTHDDIAKLPPSAQQNVWQIRREFKMDQKKVPLEADTPSFRVSPIAGNANAGGAPRAGENDYDDDEDESDDDEDYRFSQV